MAVLKDVLQFVAYGTALDIVEVSDNRNRKHLFPACDITTREIIEDCHSELLERELNGGIHAEGFRRDTLFIPIKKS